MQASAMQIQAIIGCGCDRNFELYMMVVAIKIRPKTEKKNRMMKMRRIKSEFVPGSVGGSR